MTSSSAEQPDPNLLAWFTAPSNEEQSVRAADAALVREWQAETRQRKAQDELLQLLLPRRQKLTAADYERARSDRYQWESIGYEASDVARWLAAGVRSNQAEVVADLVEQGITPECSMELCVHPSTGETVTIFHLANSYHRAFRTLRQALDAAGIERIPGVRPSWFFRRR